MTDILDELRLAVRRILRVRRRLDSLPVDHVLFMHIPKTAGMSLYRALEEWATPALSIRFARGGAGDRHLFGDLTREEVTRLRLISGHLSFRDFDRRLGTLYVPITLLRDPVERTLSLYSFVVGTPDHPWYDTVAGMDLDEFLAWVRDMPWTVDQQCMFICSRPDPRRAFDVLSRDFALACSLEHLTALTAELGRLLEHEVRLPNENVSATRLSRTDLGSGTLRTVADMNRADQQLYERVRDAGLIGYGVGHT